MDKGIADGIGAAHRLLQCGQRSGVIAAEKIGIANGGLYPCRRFPVFFGGRQQVPGVLISGDGIAVFAFCGEGIADFAEAVDAGVQVRFEFGHGVACIGKGANCSSMAAGVRGCVDRAAVRWDNRPVLGFQRSIFMANSVIQTSIDEKINAEAASVLAEMGMTVSQAIRLMLTRVAQEKRLPFDPVLTPREETLAALQEARSESLKSYANMAELLQDLDDA